MSTTTQGRNRITDNGARRLMNEIMLQAFMDWELFTKQGFIVDGKAVLPTRSRRNWRLNWLKLLAKDRNRHTEAVELIEFFEKYAADLLGEIGINISTNQLMTQIMKGKSIPTRIIR